MNAVSEAVKTDVAVYADSFQPMRYASQQVRYSELSNRQKVAVLLISLGPELSSQILSRMTEEEMEQITLEIAAMPHVSPDVRREVMQEFRHMIIAQQYIATGGIEYARLLLERTLGEDKTRELLDRLTSNLQVRPFEFIRQADPAQLINYLQNEHPQTIAMILAYMQPEQAAVVLGALPQERQADVARRIAKMDPTSPDVIRDVERVLERKLSSVMSWDYTAVGGVNAVVQVLNQSDRSTERAIMDDLEINDPELAEEIKMRMFVFEDIVKLDDRSLQRVIQHVDLNEDMPLALKTASDEVKAKIFRNISKRAAETLRENIAYLGPVRLRDVEEAQQRIVAVIRQLEEAGEIIVRRGQEDEIIV